MNLSLLKQDDATVIDIDRIIKLKMQHWSHSYESQKRWMDYNINPNDYNLLLESENKLIGFLNLVNIQCLIDDVVNLSLLGLGNVCVLKEKSNNGIGLLLMQGANFYIKSLGFNAALLCSDKLTYFYEKAGWSINNSKVFIEDKRFNGNIMFLKNIESKKINLDRNF